MNAFLTSVNPVQTNRCPMGRKVFVLVLDSSCLSLPVVAGGVLFFVSFLIRSSCTTIWPFFFQGTFPSMEGGRWQLDPDVGLSWFCRWAPYPSAS